MTDDAANRPLHVTIDADVRIDGRSRAAGATDQQLADLLTGLVQRHAWEAGLEIVDPASVRVSVRPAASTA